MNLERIYMEEDFFPMERTNYVKQDYGILFYNEEDKDSYDFNHAIIFENKVSDINEVLDDIIKFYKNKGIKPMLYQSASDDGYFNKIAQSLLKYGFKSWNELQKYMVLSEKNTISSPSNINVQKISNWDDAYGIEIFKKAEEPWEIEIVKKALKHDNTLFFVAFYNEKPVGMMYAHTNNELCRVDYLLVSKECRNIGVGRALVHYFVNYCHANGIINCYLWPDGETAERIYYEAGFRQVEVKQAARAIYNEAANR